MQRYLAAPAFALVLSMSAAPALAQDARLDMIFGMIDADRDGRISDAEMTAAKTRRFERADRDGDGKLSAAERSAVRARFDAARDAVDRSADRMDRDGDGALSLAEFTARSPFFALIDIDGDGAISRAEADRAAAILAR